MRQWDKVRQMYHHEGKSIRQIAKATGHARETVTKLVNQSEPPSYQRQQDHPAPKLGPYRERLREMVRENRTLPKKQRWTTPRMFNQLVTEGYTGAEPTVRHYVAKIRKEEAQQTMYLPLAFDAGMDAQVDWGEAVVIIGGVEQKVQTFHITLNYSRYHFMMAFPSQKQECFAAGHVAAFDFFGGIPRRIAYDNLKTAVKKVLVGHEREEQAGFIALRNHYLFQRHFCTPGAGHEKGIVEGMVGFGRRRYLSPPPSFGSYEELNAFLAEQCRADQTRQVAGQPASIGDMFAEEKVKLAPLPTHRYECCRVTSVTRNKYSQVRIETNRYSVPSDMAGKQLTAKIYPFEVKLFAAGSNELVATHPRCYDRQQMICDWRHYLPLLVKKPHALLDARPFKGWRDAWPPIYATLYDQLCEKEGQTVANRLFVQILYLHRLVTAAQLEAAMQQAVAHKTPHLEGVMYWLKRARQTEIVFTPADLKLLPHLAEIGTQTAPIGQYDQLRGSLAQAQGLAQAQDVEQMRGVI